MSVTTDYFINPYYALSSFGAGVFNKHKSKKNKGASYGLYNNMVQDDAATQRLQDYFGEGIDVSGLLDSYQDFLTKRINENPDHFYRSNWDKEFDNYIADETANQQRALQNYADKTFQGFGGSNSYLDNYWTNTSDDAFVNDFLNTQQNLAQQKLDTARDRGFLNTAGYNNAMDQMNVRRKAANSEAQTLTGDVLSGYRDDLAGKVGGIMTDIGNYDLSMNSYLTPDKIDQTLDSAYGDQQRNFESDMYGALSGYQPFDVSNILANARNTQGVISTNNDSQLLGSMQDNAKNKNKTTTGNQGIF